MRTQLQPLTEKTHALLGSAQAPLHSGAAASPQETLRHSHEPVPAAAPHFMPGAHDPVHSPFAKRHPVGDVVVVVPTTVVVVVKPPELAGRQSDLGATNATARRPNASSSEAAPGPGEHLA